MSENNKTANTARQASANPGGVVHENVIEPIPITSADDNSCTTFVIIAWSHSSFDLKNQ